MRGRSARRRLAVLAVVIALALVAARIIASYVIEYQWWREMNQVPTWIAVMLYGLSPVAVAALLSFVVLFAAHARGMKFAGIRLGEHSRYAKLSTAVLLLAAILLAASAIDAWTVVRYFGGRNLPAEATAWQDSVFGQPLGFYLFDLPFYTLLRGFALVLAVALPRSTGSRRAAGRHAIKLPHYRKKVNSISACSACAELWGPGFCEVLPRPCC